MSYPGQRSAPIDIEVVEGLFADYITDPASVSAQKRNYFDSLPADPQVMEAKLFQGLQALFKTVIGRKSERRVRLVTFYESNRGDMAAAVKRGVVVRDRRRK